MLKNIKKLLSKLTSSETKQKSFNTLEDKTSKQNFSDEEEEKETPAKTVQQFAVKNTPFTVVKVDKSWFLTMGKYRLTNTLSTRKEAEAEAEDTSWDRIMQIMHIVCLEHDKEKENELARRINKRVDEITAEKIAKTKGQ